MADLESLPILALQGIFRFLGLAERLRLRRVSKKWMLAVETMRPQRDLCIYSLSYPLREKWAFSNEEVACEDMLYCNLTGSDNVKSKLMPFIEELQRLYLYWTGESSRFFLRNLPLLNKLKVLVLRSQYSSDFCFLFESWELELSSKSLEKLSITFTDPTGMQLDLDTPSLHSLVLWDRPVHSSRDPVKYCFRYPLEVRYLQCIDFNSMLGVFKNLQELVCWQISFPFDLNEYRSLRKVNIYPLLEDEHDTLNRLTEQRDRLHRKNLQILFSGFDCTRLHHYDIGSKMLLDDENLEKLATNRSKLIEPIPWSCYLGFEPLYKVFGKIRKDLPKIFSRIQTIEMGLTYSRPEGLEVADVVNFLAETKLTKLILKDYNFQSEFYELLPAVQSIKELTITEKSLDSEHYAHLAKLNNLSSIFIDSEMLSKAFVRKFLNSSFFEILRFTHATTKNYFSLNIYREGGRYRLSSRSKVYKDSENSVDTENYPERMCFKKSDELIEEVLSLEDYHQISCWIS